ncbi:hypothetical protein H4R24_004218 [Coemansia sp. RSA 988]|nr:hypothetical protein H4R24_004218 [Coemansia sp. RSA 988]
MERDFDFNDEDIDQRLRYFTYIPKDVYPEVAMSASEWAFYVFDTIMIFLAFVIFVVVFIGHNFPRRVHGRISSTEAGNAPAGSSMHLVDKDGYPLPSV